MGRFLALYLAALATAFLLAGCAALPLAVPLAEVAIKGAVAAYQVHAEQVAAVPPTNSAPPGALPEPDHPSMAEMPTPP